MTSPAPSSASDPTTDYARAVGAGLIIAGPSVRAACKRHLTDLGAGAKRGLRWDAGKAQLALDFFSEILKVEVKGKVEQFVLLPFQVFIVGSIFGWMRKGKARRFRKAYVEIGKGPLALDTPVPTPSGWTTMGELKAGDTVFDEGGRPTLVTAVTPVFTGQPCFEVEFDSGEVIVCDESHEWWTEKRDRHRLVGARRSALEIKNTLRRSNGIYQSANHSVPLAGAIAPDNEPVLPLHPYVLGAWLGDGSSDAANITSGDQDVADMTSILQGCGVEATPRRHGAGWVIQLRATRETLFGPLAVGKADEDNIQTVLRRSRLLGAKHIPDAYLRAGVTERLALLQGLMDTDGFICPRSGRCEFTSVRSGLANQVLELACSLGLKATMAEGRATIGGRDISAKYRVCFNPPSDLPVFRLARKNVLQAKKHDRRRLSGQRMIVDVRSVPSVPVKCITVEAHSHLFLAGRGFIPTGNSGKSPLAAGVGLYMMVADGELSAEVYAAGSKRDQSMIIFEDVVKMVDRSLALKRAIRQLGNTIVYELKHRRSGSVFKPVAKDKKKSGRRVSCALVDELHEHQDRYTVDMMQDGFKGREQPLILVTTNAGFDRDSICFEWHEHAIAVVEGLRDDDELFSFVCDLDPEDDPLEDDSCWPKTNPGLGHTIFRDYLESQVHNARTIPGRENQVRRLNFCQWTDADVGWMTRQAWVDCEETFGVYQKGRLIAPGFEGAKCFMALDLSFVHDLTALAFAFPEGDELLCWVEYFTPLENAREREEKSRKPYPLWIKEGLTHASPGKVIRMEHLAARLAEVLALYDVEWIAYDRYRHKELAGDLASLNVVAPFIEHPQGFRRAGQLDIKGTDGKKLDNPLWMPGSVQAMESRIIEKKIRFQPSTITRSQVSSVAIRQDPAGTANHIFNKAKATWHIDGIAALAMAVGAAEMKLPVQSLAGFLSNPVMMR